MMLLRCSFSSLLTLAVCLTVHSCGNETIKAQYHSKASQNTSQNSKSQLKNTGIALYSQTSLESHTDASTSSPAPTSSTETKEENHSEQVTQEKPLENAEESIIPAIPKIDENGEDVSQEESSLQTNSLGVLKQFSHDLKKLAVMGSAFLVSVHDEHPDGNDESIAGTGFIVDLGNGYIVTNDHVAKGVQRREGVPFVKLANNKSYETSLLGGDASMDIAVLQILDSEFDRTGLKEAKFFQGTPQVGEVVVALGSSLSFEGSLSIGTISGVNRYFNIGNYIQTDVDTYPGNSGGPLLNVHGEVVGVNTFIINTPNSRGTMGFALLGSLAQLVMQRIIEYGSFNRGYLGARTQDLTANIRKTLGLAEYQMGVLITTVDVDSPAEKVDLKDGDVITRVEDTQIEHLNNLRTLIAITPPNTVVDIHLIREGEQLVVKTMIEDLPAHEKPDKERPEFVKLGLSAVPINKDTRETYDIEHSIEDNSGLFVTDVKIDSLAYDAEIQFGDIIHSVNHKSVATLEDFHQHLTKKHLFVSIKRQKHNFFVGIIQKDMP